jgi:hypothetical protein
MVGTGASAQTEKPPIEVPTVLVDVPPLVVETGAVPRVIDDYDAPLLPIKSIFFAVFSEPMDRASTESAITLSTGESMVSGHVEWRENDQQLAFVANDPLLPATVYTFTISIDAQTADEHQPLEEGVTRVYQTVSAYTPDSESYIDHYSSFWSANSREYATTYVYLTFRPDFDQLTSRVQVEPAPLESPTFRLVPSDHSIAIQFKGVPETDYTITFLPGIPDFYGSATTHTETIHVNYAGRSEHVTSPARRYPIQFSRQLSRFSLATEDSRGQQFELTLTDGGTAEIGLYRLKPETLAGMNPSMAFPYYMTSEEIEPYLDFRRRYNEFSEIENSEPGSLSWLSEEYRLNTLVQSFQENEHLTLPISLRPGTNLPRGLYALHIATDSPEDVERGFVAAVSNASVTIKSALSESLVWVTDLETSDPLPGVSVTAYSRDGQIASGITDDDGAVRLPSGLFTDQMGVVVAQSETVYGVGMAYPINPVLPVRGYVRTNRTAYHRGDVMHFHGVLWERQDWTYRIPERQDTVSVVVREPNGITRDPDISQYVVVPNHTFAEQQLPLSAYGTFDSSFTIPIDMPDGTYEVSVRVCADENTDCPFDDWVRVLFEVKTPEIPQIFVETQITPTEILGGERVRVEAHVTDAQGLPLANVPAEIYWSDHSYDVRLFGGFNLIRSAETFFNFLGERGFTFGTPEFSGYTAAQANEQRRQDGVFDETGHVVFEDVITVQSQGNPIPAYANVKYDDGTNVAGDSADFLIHPANVYLGLRAVEVFRPLNETHSFEVLSVYPNSTARPNQRVRWHVDALPTSQPHESWEPLEPVRVPVTDGEIITNRMGQGFFEFHASKPGMYLVTVSSVDETGHETISSLRVYSTGPTPNPDIWWDHEIGRSICSTGRPSLLRLTPDRPGYQPGDTAAVFIPNPFEVPAVALITVERTGVMLHDTVSISGDAAIYHLPLTADYAPSIYFNVVVQSSAPASTSVQSAFMEGSISLPVEAHGQLLNIELSASNEHPQPGDIITFNLHLMDLEGRPVQGEVALSLIDTNIQTGGRVGAPDPTMTATFYGALEPGFWRSVGLNVRTSVGLDYVLPPRTELLDAGCGDGGGYPYVVLDVPRRWDYTPLWEPHLLTDANGNASVTITLPDRPAEWRLEARAVTMDTQVGEASLVISAGLP